MKQYLVDREKGEPGAAREALRWFYRTGRGVKQPAACGERPLVAPSPTLPVRRPSAPVVHRAAHPPSAATDLGRTPWERDLIKACREKGFLWRTEQTYREWAVRFATFLAPRSPYEVGGQETADYLSMLAVNQRASRSTQKQALNALVFFMQVALHRDLGKMEFRRAQHHVKIPTVLSQAECRQLFTGLTGTPRLMAEWVKSIGVARFRSG